MIHSQDFNQMPFFPVRSFVWVKENSSLTWSATPHWLTRSGAIKLAHPPLCTSDHQPFAGVETSYDINRQVDLGANELKCVNGMNIQFIVGPYPEVAGCLASCQQDYCFTQIGRRWFLQKILVLGLSLIIRGAWAEWEEINRVVDADREASARINNEPNTDKSDHNQILKSGVRRGVNKAGWRVPFSL